jgi:RNA polymerase sigma-70 factor (ECF subfamily)
MSSGATDRPLFPLLVSRRDAARPAISLSPAGLRDEDLLLRVEAADREAATILFDRYSDLIFGIGLRILHDTGEAEDLVQEVFLGLFEKVKGFDPSKGSARIWIVQIAYRRAFDRRRYLKGRSFYDGTDIARIENTLSGGGVLEEQLADLLTAEQVQLAFEELSEKQRATVEMFFFEGLELREISERMGETLEQTRHFYYRGLERLRRICRAWGDPR